MEFVLIVFGAGLALLAVREIVHRLAEPRVNR
jgi:hypothetical protein